MAEALWEPSIIFMECEIPVHLVYLSPFQHISTSAVHHYPFADPLLLVVAALSNSSSKARLDRMVHGQKFYIARPLASWQSARSPFETSTDLVPQLSACSASMIQRWLKGNIIHLLFPRCPAFHASSSPSFAASFLSSVASSPLLKAPFPTPLLRSPAMIPPLT